MATNLERTLVGRDSELWVDGIDTRPFASQIQVGPQSVDRPATRLSDKVIRTQPVILSGNLQMTAYNDASVGFNLLRDRWATNASSGYIAPIFWSYYPGAITVGAQVGATYITPLTSAVPTAGSEELVTHAFGGTWQSTEIYGALQSVTTAAGRHPVDSPMSSDYATQAITTVGPDIYTAPSTINAAGRPVAILAAVSSLTGTTGTRPQASFTVTDTAWLSGTLNAANSSSLTIGHTVDGSVVNLRIPQDRPNYFTGETVATVYEDIERFALGGWFSDRACRNGEPGGLAWYAIRCG